MSIDLSQNLICSPCVMPCNGKPLTPQITHNPCSDHVEVAFIDKRFSHDTDRLGYIGRLPNSSEFCMGIFRALSLGTISWALIRGYSA